VRTYTEKEIGNAWKRAYLTANNPGDFYDRFMVALRAGGERKEAGKAMLFSKQELLDVAATGREKLVVHGIFAILGMDAANEAALVSQAEEARLNGNMSVILGLAKAKKNENYTPGRTYASADGLLVRRMQGGTWMQYILDSKVLNDDVPARPLREI